MYDRQTGSEWKQSLGECIDGQLEGRTLSPLPANVLTFEQFRETYHNGVVLQPARGRSEAASETDEPAPIDYTVDPYSEYASSDGFGLDAHRSGEGREWTRDDIGPKTRVLGIERDDAARGYPRPEVREAGGVVTDEVGGLEVVVWTTETGLDAFENPGYEFRNAAGNIHADGTTWDRETGVSDDGRSLTRVPARRCYAFTWQDDHGPESFFLTE